MTVLSSSQVVLVTGCSEGGIGYELCKALHASGCRVFASARKLQAMTGLADIGIDTIQLDVTCALSRKAAVEQVVATAGRIDVLVNNAGVASVSPIAEADLEDVRSLFETNFFGLLGLTQEVVPHMAAQKSGKIVNIGSIVGYVALPWSAAYSASKAAVHSLTDALRLELSPLGIQTILIAPGLITSRIGSKASAHASSLKEDTVYAPTTVEGIKRTAAENWRTDGATSTAADVWAQRAAGVILGRKVYRHWRWGQGARLFAVMRRLPLWLLDVLLAKACHVM